MALSIVFDPILGKLRMADESATVAGSDGSAVSTAGFEVVEVAELPEAGESGKVYRVPSDDPASGNAYDEWYWTGGEWEKFGGTEAAPLKWEEF